MIELQDSLVEAIKLDSQGKELNCLVDNMYTCKHPPCGQTIREKESTPSICHISSNIANRYYLGHTDFIGLVRKEARLCITGKKNNFITRSISRVAHLLFSHHGFLWLDRHSGWATDLCHDRNNFAADCYLPNFFHHYATHVRGCYICFGCNYLYAI